MTAREWRGSIVGEIGEDGLYKAEEGQSIQSWADNNAGELPDDSVMGVEAWM
jgi:hypothetical protein